MLPKKIEKTYTDFFVSASKQNILNRKTTIMIQLAASMAIGCSHWMEHFYGVAIEKGITDKEIGAVLSVVMSVSAGRVRAQFRDARKRGQKIKKNK